MYHTMMMHIIGAVHALVLNENCISSLFHKHWKQLKDIILKFGWKLFIKHTEKEDKLCDY